MLALQIITYLIAIYEGVATFLFMQLLLRFIKFKLRKRQQRQLERIQEQNQNQHH